MNKHVNDTKLAVKAPLSEIFAALTGVTCAAVTITKHEAYTKHDVLSYTGFKAAMMTYEMKEELVKKRDVLAQDKLAKNALAFLKDSTWALFWYPDLRLSMPRGAEGKTTQDLIIHIDDMLERERTGTVRPVEKINEMGGMAVFKAAYLPKAEKADIEGANYEGEDETDDAAPAAPVAPAKRGRKKTYAWASRQPAII